MHLRQLILSSPNYYDFIFTFRVMKDGQLQETVLRQIALFKASKQVFLYLLRVVKKLTSDLIVSLRKFNKNYPFESRL